MTQKTSWSLGVGMMLTTVALIGAGCQKPAAPAAMENKPAETVMQPTEITPTVSVTNQLVKNNRLTVSEVVVEEPAWVTIHTDNKGEPGEVIGYSVLKKGTNTNVEVAVDGTKVTDKLYAMLHVDKGVIGQYEFPGADVPMTYKENVVMLSFMINDDAVMEEKPKMEVIKEKGDGVMEPKTTTPPPAAAAEKVFMVSAKNWEFSPASITVNKGDKVRFKITSVDVTHGFSLPDFGVNTQLEPGKTAEVTFTADKTGTFSFFCSVFCGSGHRDMKGTLIVK